MGGFLGDWAARKSPDHGRIYVAQVSIFSGIPWVMLILAALPRDTRCLLVDVRSLYVVCFIRMACRLNYAAYLCILCSWFGMYFVCMFLFGLCASWVSTGDPLRRGP